MNESQLTDLLERAGERTEVGPPPIDALRAGATRRRRRRTAALSLASAAVAVAVVVGGITWAASPGTNTKSPSVPAASATTALVPAGMRLVGIGHVAVAVPGDWGTNETSCGSPQKDTVVIGGGEPTFCHRPRPNGVESVELTGFEPAAGFHADETVEIGGVRAERQRVSCVETEGAELCSGGVYFPSLQVWFWAESSTNADEVDRVLDRIRMVPDRIGVPAFRVPSRSLEQPADKYSDALRAAGLKADIRSKKSPDHLPGVIVAVSPELGTMLSPGETVTVTVAG